MKLIATNKALESTLSRLIKTYTNVAFAVAWATANTSIFRELTAQPSRIKRAIIGTHFYQTHPDVLDTFAGSNLVRFMLQPKGVFHPKIYVFWNGTHWEALIGSANLTSGALTDNAEVMVLLSDVDRSASLTKEQLLEVIDGYWTQATAITKEESQSYRTIWERQQPALRRLSGQYGKSSARKPPSASSVMSMPWSKFLAAVWKDPHHGFKERCQFLQRVRTAFLEHSDFHSMELGLRKTIAGLPNDLDNRWGWFGSMKGAPATTTKQ
jgi:HKD family nuclease